MTGETLGAPVHRDVSICPNTLSLEQLNSETILPEDEETSESEEDSANPPREAQGSEPIAMQDLVALPVSAAEAL